MRMRAFRLVAFLATLLLATPAAPAATVEVAVRWNGATDSIPVHLDRPDGAGRFPAVVFLHGCDGAGPRSSGIPERWADVLVKQGYVVARPDSMTSRGFPDGTCTLEPRTYVPRLNIMTRAADAYATLAWLRRQDYVEPRRIALMGDSFGGSSTLAAMFRPVQTNGPLAAEKADGFTAAIALYPGCGGRFGSWRAMRQSGDTGPFVDHSGVYKPIAPLLILIGERDNWTPPEPCQWLADEARKAGHPVDIKVYPGAYHAFDSPRPAHLCNECYNPNISGGGQGVISGGDPAVRVLADRDATAFLARHLKGGR